MALHVILAAKFISAMFDLQLNLAGLALGFSAGAVSTKISLILAIPPWPLALLMLVIVPVVALLRIGIKGDQGGFFTFWVLRNYHACSIRLFLPVHILCSRIWGGRFDRSVAIYGL